MRLFVSIVTCMLSLSVMAQTEAVRDLPGYVDFGELNAAYGEPRVEINLGAALLGFVGALVENEDPETTDILGKLQAVRMHVYDLEGSAEFAFEHIEDVSAKLQTGGWEPIVKVKDLGEHVRVFIKMTDGVIEGLTLMAAEDGGEVAFINIIGELDPEQISKVTKSLDLDVGVD